MSGFKGVIFDRDGTLIEHVPYLDDVKKIQLLPGVIDALSLLNDHQIPCFIVTNQSGIGRGFYTVDQYLQIEAYLDRLFLDHGIEFKQTYYCPYHPDHGVGEYKQESNDRKPNPGMLKRVMDDFNFTADELVMIGDNKVDIQAAQAIDMASVLVKTGLGETFIDQVQPDYIAESLLATVQEFILKL